MTSSLLEHVTAEIRAEIARQQLPQRSLAEVLKISEAQVSARLRGRVAFDVPELEKVAALLGVPVTRFFPVSERAA